MGERLIIRANITIDKLAKLKGLKTFDTAYPLKWADRMRALGANPSTYVWCYDEPTMYGAPNEVVASGLAQLVDEALTLIHEMSLETDFYNRAPVDIRDRIYAVYSLLNTGVPE